MILRHVLGLDLCKSLGPRLTSVFTGESPLTLDDPRICGQRDCDLVRGLKDHKYIAGLEIIWQEFLSAQTVYSNSSNGRIQTDL